MSTFMANIFTNYLCLSLLTISYVNSKTYNSHSSKVEIDSSNPIYISQDDILTGTYRILESGYYIISGDLRFNFNAPSNSDIVNNNNLFSPNNYENDNLYWYPSSTATDNNLYDTNLYSLGFFAGITIECDNVIIDLNGHNIEMDYSFYLQQRFFSLIELGNRQFISGGYNNNIYNSAYDSETIEIYPSNIEIKNGLLGLTSHHSIHGNNIETLIISDIIMHNFDVTGFGCNGCKDISMTHTIIGPQNTNIPVLGRYTHARSLINSQKLKDLSDLYGNEIVEFNNRQPITVQNAIDRLINQMDMIYNSIINSVIYDNDNDEWNAASKLFINSNGYLDGSSSYGLVFNGEGISNTAIGEYNENTYDITLTNIEIKGIYLYSNEQFKLTDENNNNIKLLFGDTIDCLAVFDQLNDMTTTQYIGDAYTDIIFIIDKYLTPLPFISNGLRNVIFDGNNLLFQQFNIYGSTDIQLQSMKGAIGIRINGVSNFKIQSSVIHNIENYGVLGSKLAGEYITQSISNENDNIQYGYTGNRAQGLMIVNGIGTLNDIEIYDILSNSGSSHGVIIYDECNIGATNIRLRNIQAGKKMTQNHINSLTLPNYIPLACSVELVGANSNLYSTINREDFGDLTGHFIIGYDLCSGDATRIGQCKWCYNRNSDINYENNGGVIIENNDDNDNTNTRQKIEIASDCSNLDDGLQYILPDVHIGTVIPVICNNGWTILDGSLTPNIYDYFTSYSISHRDDTVILPNTDDHTTWREWFIPANDNTQFRVSINCDQCITDDNYINNTAYYATGDYLCFYIRKIDNLCSINDIYCNVCDDINIKYYDQPYDDNDDDSGTYLMWEQCKYIRYNSDIISDNDHSLCTHREPFVWPSLGKNGEGCTCYKPGDESDTFVYEINLAEAVGQFETNKIEPYIALEESAEYLYIELTQSDFETGTYRIIHPGTYVIMEDIQFNFNAPAEDIELNSDFSPNSFYGDNDDIWWWPKIDQENEYPGASTFYNPYTLGYFSGISIECSDVTIDLNGFSMRMSDKFYLQQRFFSLIEMSNRPFAPGKGAANWGWIEKYASNVIIKNGNLGLTSHHCIHGNFLNNVLIDNVQMNTFDVAGFGCGQCVKVTLNNLNVGPQNQNIPVLGRYTHARAILPRLKYLNQYFGDNVISFWNRDVVVSDLIDRLINQMDMVYNYVINGYEYNDDDQEWIETKKLFINDEGYQDASASYGIVFAGGAAVSAIGTRIENEADIYIENVTVHGLRHNVKEKYKVYGSSTTVTMRGFFRDTFDWEAMTDDFSNLETAKYIGNAYEDIMMSIIILNDDISQSTDSGWSFLYTTQMEDWVKNWVLTGDGSESGSDLNRWLDIHCGTDIQVHSVKGIIGVRIDGATNLNINNLNIYDLYSISNLGSMRCGEYDAPMIAGEEPYIQPGYNGHRVHGLTTVYTNGILSNINIYDLKSNYGDVYGLRIFDGCDIELNDNIKINDLYAGIIFEMNNIDMQFMIKSKVNPLPQACGLYLYSDDDNINYDNDNDNVKFISQNVIGYRICEQNIIRADQNDYFIAKSIGQCVNCIVKDAYVSGSSMEKISKSNNIPMIIMFALIGFVIISVYVICKYKFNNYYYYYASTNISENTPLLKQ